MMILDPISKAEAARYMGVKGKPDEKTAALLDKYEPIVRRDLRPAYVYRETTVEFLPEGVKLEGLDVLLTGNDIRRHLEGCDRCIVMAATVSSAADKLIRQTAVTDTAGALAVDCLCSAAIEQVCGKAEEEIFAESGAKYRTWRFSPGYGDLSIEFQGSLLNFLNARRRIGLTLSESCMMIPTKSVTAIIGLSEHSPKDHGKGCEHCSMGDRCVFRRG